MREHSRFPGLPHAARCRGSVMLRLGLVALLFMGLGCRGQRGYRTMHLPALLSTEAMEQRIVYPTPDQAAKPAMPDAPTCPGAENQESVGEGDASTALTMPRSLNTDADRARWTLEEAIAYSLQNNPRLRVYREQVGAARAGEEIAFAPFLPQFDFGFRFLALSAQALPAGSFVAGTLEGGAYAFSLPEVGVQWMLCDFGRTAGHYGQAVSRAEIAALQLTRAEQTITYEVATHYYRLLQARAYLRIREQAMKQAESVLGDTMARHKAGDADRNAVLRSEVEVSEARENLVAAREQAYDAEARLNTSLGRSIRLPLEIVDARSEPTLEGTLEDSLQAAIRQRREIDMARTVVAEALFGEQAARGDFKPKLYVRGSVLRVDSPGPISGTVEAAGIHLDLPLYHGGKRLGELRRNEALVRSAVASSQVILDNIALEVNIAYRAIASNRERIRLGVIAVEQAKENLRLTLVKYNNGDATPTDVVDAQTALTRASMRHAAADYDYLAALAQLAYATGQ